jgi:SAM-dependent methyltransferase
MNEKIGNVTLNYEFYKGTDTYSDGDVEDTILEIVKNNSYEEIEELLTEGNEWPILYHLSPIRKNILRWYDFNPEGSVLEIGAGCGAITGLFCEKTNRVVAIDLSKRRSTINAYRNKEYDNLEIMVGNFEDIRLEEKFDYVTLIGVLEYSIYYINSEDPFREMLRRVKQFLKPGGKLIVAIENKYGLKYWAGAREDHTGRNFDGIEGYHDVEKVRTFSRNMLEKLLKEAGFGNNQFYYPLPDYKLPLEVYSGDYLPGKGALREMSPSYDQNRMAYFNEVAAFDSICEDGLFEQFANSFLVISE